MFWNDAKNKINSFKSKSSVFMEVFETILVHFLCRRLSVYFVLFVRLTPRDGFILQIVMLEGHYHSNLNFLDKLTNHKIKPIDIISRLSVHNDHTVTSPIRWQDFDVSESKDLFTVNSFKK